MRKNGCVAVGDTEMKALAMGLLKRRRISMTEYWRFIRDNFSFI